MSDNIKYFIDVFATECCGYVDCLNYMVCVP